jgi:DNA recombination protein RmuC
MTTALLVVLLLLALVAIALLVVALSRFSTARTSGAELTSLGTGLEGLESGLSKVEASLRDGLAADRECRAVESRAAREEIRAAMLAQTESTLAQLTRAAEAEKRQLDTFANQLQTLTEANERRLGEIRATVEAKLKETLESDRQGRTDSATVLKVFQESLVKQLGDMSAQQRTQLDGFTKQLSELMAANDRRMDALRQAVEERLKAIQGDTSAKLEQMRATVDEKLQSTLERRLGESFKLVSERLESVQKGLGEMQSLATNVGDLKKVLANVSTRGGWGEVRLAGILEQILSPEQYEAEVRVKPGSSEKVEFAVKLPGKDADRASIVWLPIDAKFPLSVYERLTDALEKGDTDGAASAGAELESNVKGLAKMIHDKYIAPPHTTDFAIMFLPVEGLYAEVLRRRGLSELLQREYRIAVAGPTTLAALLNSLQMGFRTLAIEKRSSEVWQLLGAIKSEFGNFGNLLDRVHKQLETATNTIGTARSKSKTIQRKLRGVEELPTEDAKLMLGESRQSDDDSWVVHDADPHQEAPDV